MKRHWNAGRWRAAALAWAALAALTALASVVPAPLLAQNSFDDKLPLGRTAAPPAGPAPQNPALGRSSGPAPAPPAGAEDQDFGVRPVAQLRPSNQLHAPTPTSIPGGRVVAARQLAQWMQGQQGQQGKVMLLHAIGSQMHLPNAIPAVPASQGGSFDDAVQREFGQYLQQATGNDRSRLIVTYCSGVQCWGSYNAALRAIQLGYTNVHWYRGGMEAWQQSGLPVVNAAGPASPAPR
jgi:PQQ-dependent catabolism-associated CXXCW motif protein